MTLISEEYRKLQAEMHRTREDYGVSAGKWAATLLALADSRHARLILDYGSGRGLLKQELAKLDPRGYLTVREYDPAILSKAGAPEPAELVYCGDVMEHVERECVGAVLDDIKQLAIDSALFVIATCPASKTLPDGRNAHITVEDADWWLPQLMARWRLDTFKRIGDQSFMAVCLCKL